MPEENVELLRRLIETFNRGDVEGALAIADAPPEFEFVPSGVLIPDLSGVLRGPEGVRRLVGVCWGALHAPRIEVHELIDAGDQVFASVTFRGRGKQSGAETGWDAWGVWTVRDGRMVRFQGFTD